MIVPIYIIDKEQEKMSELVGKSTDELPDILIDFSFKDSSLDGFWIDPEDNTICFYINGISFRTPNSEKTLNDFEMLIHSR